MPKPVDLAEISEAELTALALAADPDAPIDEAAEPFDAGGTPDGLLPSWYMPLPMVHRAGRARRTVIACLVGALVLASAAGLCVTSGLPEIAW